MSTVPQVLVLARELPSGLHRYSKEELAVEGHMEMLNWRSYCKAQGWEPVGEQGFTIEGGRLIVRGEVLAFTTAVVDPGQMSLFEVEP